MERFGSGMSGFGTFNFGVPSTAPRDFFGATTFGNQSTTGFNFGSNNTGGGFFTNNSTKQWGNNQNIMVFGSQPTGVFGTSGTASVKYVPEMTLESVVKQETRPGMVNMRYNCITCMKAYANKSLEELRLEDYNAGLKGSPKKMFTFNKPVNRPKPVFGSKPAFGKPARKASTDLIKPSILGSSPAFLQMGSPVLATQQTSQAPNEGIYLTKQEAQLIMNYTNLINGILSTAMIRNDGPNASLSQSTKSKMTVSFSETDKNSSNSTSGNSNFINAMNKTDSVNLSDTTILEEAKNVTLDDSKLSMTENSESAEVLKAVDNAFNAREININNADKKDSLSSAKVEDEVIKDMTLQSVDDDSTAENLKTLRVCNAEPENDKSLAIIDKGVESIHFKSSEDNNKADNDTELAGTSGKLINDKSPTQINDETKSVSAILKFGVEAEKDLKSVEVIETGNDIELLKAIGQTANAKQLLALCKEKECAKLIKIIEVKDISLKLFKGNDKIILDEEHFVNNDDKIDKIMTGKEEGNEKLMWAVIKLE